MSLSKLSRVLKVSSSLSTATRNDQVTKVRRTEVSIAQQKVDERRFGSRIISPVGKGGLPPPFWIGRLLEEKKRAAVNRPSLPERVFRFSLSAKDLYAKPFAFN